MIDLLKKGKHIMPLYDYKCLKCGKECLLALTLKEHENGAATCPSCGSKKLEQLISSFIARTSSKS
jgi:putative FmdB family regulatory protein